MNKNQVAVILSEIGTLLELKGENSFRCNAYHNGARVIEQLDADLGELVAQGKLGAIRGIGDTLKEKITTLVTTGTLPYYEDLKQSIPAGLVQMLRIQGLGPKKVKAMYDQLGIDTLDKLREACEQGTVAGLRGFGAKTAQKILEGLDFLKTMGSRVRIDQALPLAQSLLDGMREAPGVQRIELCGSLRRRKETIADIDILISSKEPGPLMERFVKLPGVVQIIGQGDTKSSVIVSGEPFGHKVQMNADLRVVSDKQFPFALLYFTGSKEHNIVVRQRSIALGLKLNEYELAGEKKSIPCQDEADIYRALGMAYVPPELREDTGEINAALAKELPELVEFSQIQGVFHNHTVASDGSNTLEEMAAAARSLGLKYLGIGDHSQSLTIANGLSPERVRRQQAEIDALNKHLKGIHVFKGIECDILEDGGLDYDDELLATFDYVVASVHSHFKQTRQEMTARIIRAIQHPAVTMLGHATGRLILRRDAYQVDLEAVLQAAADTGTLIEINAHPQRLDLDWIHCKRGRALGVKLVINPDAHSTGDLALYRYGIDVARRGWLTKEDVYNTQSVAEISADLRRRKQQGKKKTSSGKKPASSEAVPF